MQLNERKQQVLEAVVEDHIITAEPVSSRTIARKYQLGVSPATIRNEMADLEEMGLIEQPHTSSGRIPSQQGYRYYVDRLMRRNELTVEEENQIHKVFARQARELAMIVQHDHEAGDPAHRLSGFLFQPPTGIHCSAAGTADPADSGASLDGDHLRDRLGGEQICGFLTSRYLPRTWSRWPVSSTNTSGA